MRMQRGRNQYQMQSQRSNLTTLSNQAVQLAKQIEPLQKQLNELGSKEARQANAVTKDKSKMRQAEKAASDAEKRLHNLDAQLKATAPAGKMLLLSSYLPFPYEQERQRVTGWFSK
jgi:peptidoglycan hydrolase CwlO-like protein